MISSSNTSARLRRERARRHEAIESLSKVSNRLWSMFGESGPSPERTTVFLLWVVQMLLEKIDEDATDVCALTDGLYAAYLQLEAVRARAAWTAGEHVRRVEVDSAIESGRRSALKAAQKAAE